jgi:hypothetical protein
MNTRHTIAPNRDIRSVFSSSDDDASHSFAEELQPLNAWAHSKDVNNENIDLHGSADSLPERNPSSSDEAAIYSSINEYLECLDSHNNATLSTQGSTKDSAHNPHPLESVNWDNIWNKNENDVAASTKPLFFYEKINASLALAERGKEKINERNFVEAKYMLVSFFALVCLTAAPFIIYVIMDILFGKPRIALHDHAADQLKQTLGKLKGLCSSDIDSDSDTINSICHSRASKLSDFSTLFNLLPKTASSPQNLCRYLLLDVLGKQSSCEPLARKIFEFAHTYLATSESSLAEYLPAYLTGIFALFFVCTIMSLLMCFDNDIYQKSIKSLKNPLNIAQDEDEKAQITEVMSNLQIQTDNNFIYEDLTKNLTEKKSSYYNHLYFFAGTKKRLLPEIQQRIFAKFDALVLTEPMPEHRPGF